MFDSRWRIRWPLGIFLLGAVAVALAACTQETGPTAAVEPASISDAIDEKPFHYVGSKACQGCHHEQYQDWNRSQHFLAIQPVTQNTVLGAFDGTSFERFDQQSIFSKRGDKYFVRVDGADGTPEEFEITHTFGVDPLQQYLITFPDGRRQALGIAWDTRSKTGGGQRWFHLYPDERLTAGDPLHWTGRNQNWNYMCADCHSTDLRKNYDPDTKTFETTWAEISVGCEACHGPGSAHLAEAQSGLPDGDSNTSPLAMLKTPDAEIEVCARCHSRRGILAEGFVPGNEFLDHYLPALLDEDLYHADGQILDEVYVYGSFLQSKMYQRGVRCSDCHDPHKAELKLKDNATCTRCHQASPPSDFPTLTAKVYDTPSHHFHDADSEGARCVACHMPSKLYMIVDERHDHSFRVPRPDLSASLNVPNTCSACHVDETAQWAADEIRKRYPEPLPPHFGEAIAAVRNGSTDAERALVELVANDTMPAIARATALSMVYAFDRVMSSDAIDAGLKDDDPLIRLGALRGAERYDPQRRWRVAEPLLDDPLRAVRNAAAILLVSSQLNELSDARRAKLGHALAEYEVTQKLNADRPEALTNLGNIYLQTGDRPAAEKAYLSALDLSPLWVPAAVNLADLYRDQGRDEEAGELLRIAVSAAPDSAEAHHAYGLLLVRRGRLQDALAELKDAYELSPRNARYAYVYGVALSSAGQPEAASSVLYEAHQRFPRDTDILFALTTIERDRGNTQQAIVHAQKLVELRPSDPATQRLLMQLQRGSNSDSDHGGKD